MAAIRIWTVCTPILAVSLCASALPQSSSPAPPKGGSWAVRLSPVKVVNGAPLFLRVTPPVRLLSLTGQWLGHELVFERSGNSWFVLAGVGLDTRKGSYPLKLEGVNAKRTSIQFEKKIVVSAAKYPSVQLTVSKQFTEPSLEQQEEIKTAQDVKHEAFSHITPEREWSGAFVPPVAAEVSGVFGTRRLFNGATKSVHQGLDYRVPPGTPITAVNRGTVILARPLYFEGNCVVIDHGQGLLTLYLHLSELKVKEGDKVERGTEVGLSGATGRATGPHLHLAVRWQGVYLNPAALLKLRLPDTESRSARTRE